MRQFLQKKIREKISTMSFEDLQKLKEKIGSKIYNETVFGKSLPKPKTTKFKRLNKNRPREMSSKRPIKIRNQIEAVKRNLPRDPRFDPLSGNFDKKTFKANYSFLKDLKQKEVEQLKREYENETNVEKKKKIKFVIQRMASIITLFINIMLCVHFMLFRATKFVSTRKMKNVRNELKMKRGKSRKSLNMEKNRYLKRNVSS